MNYPIKRNGYIYSKGTKAGFLRMQRQGIPRPLFSLEDKLAKLLRARYKALIRKLLKDLKAQCQQNNITLDKSPEEENLEELMNFFEEMGKVFGIVADLLGDLCDRKRRVAKMLFGPFGDPLYGVAFCGKGGGKP